MPRAMLAAPLEHSIHLDTSTDKCVSVLTVCRHAVHCCLSGLILCLPMHIEGIACPTSCSGSPTML